MRTAEEKFELLKQQVFSKIRWGDSREEVAAWLEEKHGMPEVLADYVLAEAETARRKAVRRHAIIRVILSTIGLAMVSACLWMNWRYRFIPLGWETLKITGGVIMLASASVTAFLRYLHQLVTGQKVGSVD